MENLHGGKGSDKDKRQLFITLENQWYGKIELWEHGGKGDLKEGDI